MYVQTFAFWLLTLSAYAIASPLFFYSAEYSKIFTPTISSHNNIRNILACVAKWHKVVAKILNMFKNFMRQNSSQNSRKVVAGVSNPSRTCRRPHAI